MENSWSLYVEIKYRLRGLGPRMRELQMVGSNTLQWAVELRMSRIGSNLDFFFNANVAN